MKRVQILLIISVVFSIQYGCKKSDVGSQNQLKLQDTWLVDASEILYMGLERDRIQSIDSPVLIPIHKVDMQANEQVFSLHHNGITKVYPQSVMGIHEIVNDQIEDLYYAVTYCPITGSGIAWNRNINGNITEFGVSGMLYRDNLIPYDRNTLSNWSQMKSICVNGELTGYEAETMQLITASFAMIKNAYPSAFILDHTACGTGSCGTLKATNDFGDPDDTTELPVESSFFGTVERESLLLIDMQHFEDSLQVYETTFKKHKLIIVGKSSMDFFAAFSIDQNLSGGEFKPVQNALPVVMEDEEGNTYDLFGNVISGPDKGYRLSSPNSYSAHTFAWQALFNEIVLYQ